MIMKKIKDFLNSLTVRFNDYPKEKSCPQNIEVEYSKLREESLRKELNYRYGSTKEKCMKCKNMIRSHDYDHSFPRCLDGLGKVSTCMICDNYEMRGRIHDIYLPK